MADKTDNIKTPGGHGAEARIKGAAVLAYRTLASTRASAFILLAMALLFLAGVIFRQGGLGGDTLDVESLVFFERGNGLSGLFSSPIFIALYLALFANLVVGAYDRVQAVRSSKGGARKSTERSAPTHSISLTQNGAEAAADVRRALEVDLGFRVITPGDDWVVMEKGLPYGYLVWAHYAAVAICLVGIALTFLFAFEQTVTLTMGRPVAIEAVKRGGASLSSTSLQLVSGPFSAGYTERAEGADPDSIRSKLAASLSHERPVYEMRAGSLYPVDWKLDIAVMDDGVTVLEKAMGPGDPLRYGNFTFYLDGLDQTFRVRVEENPLMLNVRNNDELVIPGIGPGLGLPVRFSVFKTGTLEKIDGPMERISPHTRMTLSGKSNSGEDLGRISPGGSIYINGASLTLVDVVVNPVLGYRYDPGAGLLRWGGVLLLATMALRLFGFSQMAAYRVDYSAPIVRLHLHIASKGVFASSDRLFKKLERIITSNDIRPIPIAGGRLK